MPKAAAIYCRISDDRTGDEAGVQRQQRDCETLAERRSWPVARVYVDNDVSAWSGRERRQYRQMLDDIKGGLIDAVIVWHLDRLHRHPKELEDFFVVCDAAGLTNMATFTGDLDLSTEDGRFHARILGAVARKESDDKSRRIRRKMDKLAEKGEWKGGGTRPFGFKADRVTHEPREARLIREAADRVLAGESLWAIATSWTSRGITTVTGKPWRTHVIKTFLTSPRTAGLRKHRGEVARDKSGQPIPAVWKPIISEEQFERLNLILNDPHRRKAHGHLQGGHNPSYPLTGMVFCGHCGMQMVARPTGEKKRRYVCGNGPNFNGCGRVFILSEPLEELVAQRVFSLEGTFSENGHPADASDDGQTEELLVALRRDEQTLAELAQRRFVSDDITEVEYAAARKPLLGRIEETKAALGKAHTPTKPVTWKDLLAQVTKPDGTIPPFSEYIEEVRRDAVKLEQWRAWVRRAVERIVIQREPKPGRNFFNPERVEIQWRGDANGQRAASRPTG